jgi:hypothetical protein
LVLASTSAPAVMSCFVTSVWPGNLTAAHTSAGHPYLAMRRIGPNATRRLECATSTATRGYPQRQPKRRLSETPKRDHKDVRFRAAIRSKPVSGPDTAVHFRPQGGNGLCFYFFQSRKCLRQVTQGCSGSQTGGISRLSAETCCAISWPELSRPTPRIFAPFVRIRHRQTKPAAAPRRAAQLAPRPLPTLSAR